MLLNIQVLQRVQKSLAYFTAIHKFQRYLFINLNLKNIYNYNKITRIMSDNQFFKKEYLIMRGNLRITRAQYQILRIAEAMQCPNVAERLVKLRLHAGRRRARHTCGRSRRRN